MKRMKLMLASLLLCGSLFTGCSEEKHSHTFSSEWTTNETHHWHAATCEHAEEKSDYGEHVFGSNGECSCGYYDEEHDASLRVFTAEKLDKLVGKFNSSECSMSITVDGAVIESGGETRTLHNQKIKGTGFETIVTYTDDTSNVYTLKWAKADFDKHDIGYMVPSLSVKGVEGSIQLQPSIAEAQGWYDGYQMEMDYGLQIYIVSDTFNKEVGMYQMFSANFSYEYMVESIYLASSYVKIGKQVYLGLAMFDNQDLERGHNEETWNYFLTKDEKSGTLYMCDVVGEHYQEWWTRPSFFLGEFLQASTSEYTLSEIFSYYNYDAYSFSVNEEKQTVSIGYDDPVPYVEGFDEQGAYCVVGDLKIRGTNYGISVEKEGVVEVCPVYFSSAFFNLQFVDSFKFYVTSNLSLSVGLVCDMDWDTWEEDYYVAIDGEKADESELVIFNNKVYLKATVGEDEIYFAPYDEGIVEVYFGDSICKFVDDSLCYNLVGEYFTGELATYEICDDYEVKFEEQSIGFAYPSYDEYYDTICLKLDNGGIIFELVSDCGIIGVEMNGEDNILYNKDYVESFYGTYAGSIGVVGISDTEFTIENETLEMVGINALTFGDGSVYPAFMFGYGQNVNYFAVLEQTGVSIYKERSGDQGPVYYGSVIPKEMLDSVVGEYDYLGAYGVEKIVLTDSYELSVHVMNETKDDIVFTQVDYNSYNQYGEVVLEFIYVTSEGVAPVQIHFDGNNHANIFVVKYLEKVFFDNQGLYGTSSDSFVSITDNTINCNGSEVVISEVNGNVVTGTLDSTPVEIQLLGTSVVVTIDGSAPVTYSKVNVSYADFACEPALNVGNLGEDIKVTAQGVFAHSQYDAEGVWTQITDCHFEFDDNGEVIIVASYKMAYTYTISIVEGNVVIEGESSLPPLPPPPPPLPF